MSVTPYVETEALLAVMEKDRDRLRELLAGMLPGELEIFWEQASDLDREIGEEVRRRRGSMGAS